MGPSKPGYSVILSCVAEVHVGGKRQRWDILPEQAGCCRRSCLQRGAPARGAKPKCPWGLAAGGDAVMRPCLHREIQEALGELRRQDKKQQKTEKKLPQEPQTESVGMTRDFSFPY